MHFSLSFHSTYKELKRDLVWEEGVGIKALFTVPTYKILADKFETLPQGIAKKWNKECMAGPVFQRFFDGKIKGELPVSVLSETEKQALGTTAQTVWLSRTTLDEHKIRYTDIGIDDYRLIPEIIQFGEVYQQGDSRLVYLMKKNRLYRAALKRTKDGRGNYYLTCLGQPRRKLRKRREKNTEE